MHNYNDIQIIIKASVLVINTSEDQQDIELHFQ